MKGGAFFNDRPHHIILSVERFFHVLSTIIDPAIDPKGNAMAKSHYQFKKRQKELAKKKKKAEKRQRKLEIKTLETAETENAPISSALEADETESDPIPSTPVGDA